MAMLLSQFALADSMDNPTATNVKYYQENGMNVGLQQFTLSPYTYYSISRDKAINPRGGATVKLDDSALKEIAIREIFPKWSVIAEGVFRDQADQLVTIKGSGMMSSKKGDRNSFDRQFNFRKKGVNEDYSDDDWSIGDFAEMLARTDKRHDGSTSSDCMHASGIVSISSLADARTLMGQEVRNCFSDNDNTVDDFLGNDHKGKNKYRLPDLDNDSTGGGFASIISCVNQGAINDYDYVSFGLAVYDFDVSPIAANQLKYITAADQMKDGLAIFNGEKGDVNWNHDAGISFNDSESSDFTKIYNRTRTETEAESSIGKVNSVENTLSSEESFEWGMTQHLGTEVTMGKEASFCKVAIEVSNEWSELWSTVKGESHSKGEEKSRSQTTHLTMPPHTAATIAQSLSETSVQERYNQPVAISYKVAIFAISGDCYNGTCGGIESDRYDKQWLSVIFDGSDQQETSGCSALGSLYNRAILNRDTGGYDGAKGKLNSWCDKKEWKKSNKIDWGEVEKQFSNANETRGTHNIPSKVNNNKSTLADMATEIPMAEQAFILKTNKKVGVSDVRSMLPLYPLSSVNIKDGSKKRYQLSAGDTMYLDELAV